MVSVEDRCFSLHLTLLSLFGLYRKSDIKHEFMYKIFTIFVYFILKPSIVLLSIIKTGIEISSSDFLTIVDRIIVINEITVYIIKQYPFVFYHLRLTTLITQLNTNFTQNPHLTDEENKLIATCKNVFKFGLTGSALAFLSWITVPFMDHKKLFPIEVIAPDFVIQNRILYIIYYLYVSIAAGLNTLSDATVDAFIIAMIYYGSFQLKVLKTNLLNIDAIVQETVELDETSEKRKRELIYNKIIEAANHYEAIIRYVKEINEIMELTCFTVLISSAIRFSLCYFQVLMLDIKDNMHLFNMTVYTLLIVTLVFLYCLAGNEIYKGSDTITEALYMINWYNYDAKSKKILLILLERSQKSLIIKAGGIIPLTLETFVGIIKRAYSILALVQNFV